VKIALDTSVIVDHLNGYEPAVDLIVELIEEEAEFVSSMVVRTEVLAGMRANEEKRTRAFLSLIEWDPVTEEVSEGAGALGRKHLRASSGIDTPDLLLAELAQRLGIDVLTMNVKHFKPMFPALKAPYSY
jgi:predicted nucleic acid-binding protein